MPFVVDASVTICWLLPDEVEPLADHAYERLAGDEAVVPWIWWFEVRNVLISNERRGRIDAATTDRVLSVLRRHPIRLDAAADEAAVVALARRHRLTVYDAAYLELSRRLGSPLATLDTALAHAARAEKVSLLTG
ncbi:ribonuclease VapC [Allostella vacuolata]|nr:ribonuclease VapC [Stella vacuolata]